jgi:hypothetical protein
MTTTTKDDDQRRRPLSCKLRRNYGVSSKLLQM